MEIIIIKILIVLIMIFLSLTIINAFLKLKITSLNNRSEKLLKEIEEIEEGTINMIIWHEGEPPKDGERYLAIVMDNSPHMVCWSSLRQTWLILSSPGRGCPIPEYWTELNLPK